MRLKETAGLFDRLFALGDGGNPFSAELATSRALKRSDPRSAGFFPPDIRP
jgi:hypothetical protein